MRREGMEAKRDRQPNPKRVEAGKKSRRAKMAVFEQQLPVSERLDPENATGRDER
jgi:hypothetical protein